MPPNALQYESGLSYSTVPYCTFCNEPPRVIPYTEYSRIVAYYTCTVASALTVVLMQARGLLLELGTSPVVLAGAGAHDRVTIRVRVHTQRGPSSVGSGLVGRGGLVEEDVRRT